MNKMSRTISIIDNGTMCNNRIKAPSRVIEIFSNCKFVILIDDNNTESIIALKC